MRGNYASPSELLLALRETGKSYWDLIGKPLNQNTGYNLNNPHAAEEKQYNEWYDSLKLSDEDNIKLQQLLSEYDKNVKSNTDSLPKYKKGKDKFRSFAALMGPRIYRELHKQGIYSNNTYDNMMRQLAWESNYANSLNAINNHNYAGIRTSATKYAKYKNDDLFAQEYVSLIKRKYPNAVKAKNPVLYAKALKANGYYEDSVEHYAQSLAAMSSISNAVKAHMAANPSQYEVEVLLEDLKKQSELPAVSTRVAKPINREPINKEPFVNTPIPTKAPLITRPEYLESNSLIKKSFELNMNNMLLGKEFLFNLPGLKKGKDSKKSLSDEQYIKIMEDVANANYERWGYPNQDAALLYVLNANDYDYRGYYNKYPPNSANSLTHWSDEFKTAYHPSFSDESKYSGHKSKYNPDGIVGGHWYNEMFVPSFDQLRKLNKLPGFEGGKDDNLSPTHPFKRGRMPAHPRNREKDPEAFDAAQQWEADMQQVRQQEEEQNKAYVEEKLKRNTKAAEEFNRRKDTVMSALSDIANSAPFTGSEVNKAAKVQRQEKLDKWHDTQKAIDATMTAGELAAAGYGVARGLTHFNRLLARRAAQSIGQTETPNLVRWNNRVAAIDKPQIAMNVIGGGIDAYLFATADNSFDGWENGMETGANIAGIFGGTNRFKMDAILDGLGYGAAAWDIVKHLPPLSGALENIRQQSINKKAYGGSARKGNTKK